MDVTKSITSLMEGVGLGKGCGRHSNIIILDTSVNKEDDTLTDLHSCQSYLITMTLSLGVSSLHLGSEDSRDTLELLSVFEITGSSTNYATASVHPQPM